MAAAIHDAEAAFAAARQAAIAKHEARKARIGKAYQASKEKGLADIENQTGTRKYELQKRMLQAERDRDTGLANAATTLEEFRANLAAEQAALTSLEGAAQRRFQGLPEVCSRPVKAYQKAAPPAPALDENQLLAELRDLLGKTRSDLERFRRFLVAAGVQVPAALGADRRWERFRWCCSILGVMQTLTGRRASARAGAWSSC